MESIDSYRDICKLARLLSIYDVPVNTISSVVNSILGGSWYNLYDDLEYLFMIEIESRANICLYDKLLKIDYDNMSYILNDLCGALKCTIRHSTFYQYLLIIKYYKYNTFNRLNSSLLTRAHYVNITCDMSCYLYDYYDYLIFTDYSINDTITYKYDSLNEWPKLSIGDKVCCDYDTFIDRFREFTQNIFDDLPDLPVNNMLFAGGAINKMLRINYDINLVNTSDIDIFIVHTDDDAESIAQNIIRLLASKYNNTVYYYRAGGMYNVFIYGLKRCIQIIYNKEYYPAIVLDSFDFMHSKVGFIDGHIICDYMYLITLITMHTWSDTNKLSSYRLYKSYVEGYTYDSCNRVADSKYILHKSECEIHKKNRHSRVYPGYIETDDIQYTLSQIYNADICTIDDDFNAAYKGQQIYDIDDIDMSTIMITNNDNYTYITLNNEDITYFKSKYVSNVTIRDFIKGFAYDVADILKPFVHLMPGRQFQIHDNHTILELPDAHEYYSPDGGVYGEIVYAIKIANVDLPVIVEVVRIY